jgi:hypothetical protein
VPQFNPGRGVVPGYGEVLGQRRPHEVTGVIPLSAGPVERGDRLSGPLQEYNHAVFGRDSCPVTCAQSDRFGDDFDYCRGGNR